MKYAVAPGEAMEIQVTAKQWLWQFEYPGRLAHRQRIHVPVNKTGAVHHDQRGRAARFLRPRHAREARHHSRPLYRRYWFTPNVLGEHNSTCAEYCGKDHSDMHAQADRRNAGGFRQVDGNRRHRMDLDSHAGRWGKIQWERKGCKTCHTWTAPRARVPAGRASRARW